MSQTMYEAFVSDLVETMTKRFQEAETESKEAPEDQFKSGRSLAYFEIKDIIESRLKIYGIVPEQASDE